MRLETLPGPATNAGCPELCEKVGKNKDFKYLQKSRMKVRTPKEKLGQK